MVYFYNLNYMRPHEAKLVIMSVLCLISYKSSKNLQVIGQLHFNFNLKTKIARKKILKIIIFILTINSKI